MARKTFKLVAICFLENKGDNKTLLVENLLKAYKSLGCNMSVKIPFALSSCPHPPPPNCRTMSSEQGESQSMLADYCWIVTRDVPFDEYNRQAKKCHVDTE